MQLVLIVRGAVVLETVGNIQQAIQDEKRRIAEPNGRSTTYLETESNRGGKGN